MPENKMLKLAARPQGMAKRDDFEITTGEAGEPGAGEFLVKVEMISIDPAMRGWMNEGKSYVPPVAIGEVMRALAGGTVVASNHPKYKEGDAVYGLFGVQEYAVSDGQSVSKLDLGSAGLEDWLGGLGMPGITAYFGLLDVCQPKEGETVVVSAASGAVGSIVGQIAKIKGCRVVGIAGGPEKCAFVTGELGFDACIDYKNDNIYEALKRDCPDGIDIYFENVGGEIFDTVLTQMNTFGRIAVCGMISAYNATSAPEGPKNLRSILVNRLNMRGFIVFDFFDRYPEAIKALAEWHAEGLVKFRQDVRGGGIDAYPDVLNLLFTGGNNGKLVLKV
ncbi:MAG: NADP-dependent oxidoreductase [Hyphomicrobiales bacterium]